MIDDLAIPAFLKRQPKGEIMSDAETTNAVEVLTEAMTAQPADNAVPSMTVRAAMDKLEELQKQRADVVTAHAAQLSTIDAAIKGFRKFIKKTV